MAGKIDFFPENFKKARKKQGLTQRELSVKLGYSEKTVSKWECGAAVPDVETLFLICDLLQTNIDTLFLGERRYFLGIDGGGTKTELALADDNGAIIRALKVGGCNPMDIGIAASRSILKDAIYEICKDIPLSKVTAFAGIAGGTSGNMKEQLHQFFSELGFADFDNDSDNLNIIAAGLGERDGITVILGTGFCIYTQKNTLHRRIGGWGYLIDSAGSGYDLGRDALRAYFAAYEGSGEPTALTEEIERIYTGGAQNLVSYIYEGGKNHIASFAPAVFAALSRGDKTAEKILENNMRETARMITVSAREFNGKPVPIILAGGLTTEKILVSCLKKHLPDEIADRVSALDCKPVMGAVTLARKLGGTKN